MNLPNLASRPYLNTRPVWLVTIAAALLAAIFLVLNVRLYLASDQSLGETLALREQLRAEHAALNEEIRSDVQKLERVPWRSLSARVAGVNAILKEHAFSWLEMLGRLERVLPWNVRVITVMPDIEDEKVMLTISAVAQTREGMLDFLDGLIADPNFDNPLPSREVWPESSQAVGYLFSLEVRYVTEEAP